MAVKTILDSPSITDTIVFDILTPDASGCFPSNPYKINNVTIYFVEKSFNAGKPNEYINTILNPDKERKAIEAEKTACQNPTAVNIANAQKLRSEAEMSAATSSIFYNEATAVAVFGSDLFPAWLSSDVDNALVLNVPFDEDSNPQFGHFQLTWTPKGKREGDYFICWTWTPFPAGDSLSAFSTFHLNGDTKINTSIPTHITPEKKYEILLERYLPDMFKMSLADADLSPTIIEKLNQSVALGFTALENLTNQILDLLDANVIDESLLTYLANIFNLKLKSDDPTKWRRQIKRAIPLFKRKGTLIGLTEALDQAGIKLNKFTKLWQIVSKYTWIDSFVITDPPQTEFILSKLAILPIDIANFEIALRVYPSEDYTVLGNNYVSLANTTVTTLTWEGETQFVPISLNPNDVIKVTYKVRNVPDITEQNLENYIRTLSQADLRDELDQTLPPKNWNVRVIEEDDPLFDVLISERHPFHDPLIYGQIRTEFPYSENIYNMDEYNASTRDSENPCHLNKDFLDDCSYCQSSKFIVDLELEQLSNDRIAEAGEIIDEFVPFHAQLHQINLSGGINEFIIPPIEEINFLIQFVFNESVISGSDILYFNRAIIGGLSLPQYQRDMLASSSLVVSSAAGTAYNEEIIVYSPNLQLGQVPFNTGNVFEIMAPHPQSGDYTISQARKNIATITGISEPFSQSAFTYRISDVIYSNTVNIYQDDLFTFTDANLSFSDLGLKTEWDVAHDSDYSGGAWSLQISSPPSSAGNYIIHEVLPDGSIVLNDPSKALPTSNTNGIIYQLWDDTLVSHGSSSTGSLKVQRRGKVTITDISITSADALVNPGFFVNYLGIQYKILDFVENEIKSFHIDNWTLGDILPAAIDIYQRLGDNQIGFLKYNGWKLQTLVDQEAALGISNGANPPLVPLEDNKFKENYLILINSFYYAMVEIDGVTITLGGSPMPDWTTLSNGGTPVTYDIYQFIKTPQTNVQGHDFNFIDRRGKEEITYSGDLSGTISTPLLRASILNKPKNEKLDMISQQENINIEIQYRDGTKEIYDI